MNKRTKRKSSKKRKIIKKKQEGGLLARLDKKAAGKKLGNFAIKAAFAYKMLKDLQGTKLRDFIRRKK